MGELNNVNRNGEISRREFLGLASPLGKVGLDESKCTGCGLCALDCPTGALHFSGDGDGRYRLLFKHNLCDACARCVEVCPEQCLHLERALELDKLSAIVLFEDKMVTCARCGKLVGPQKMLDRIKEKLSASGKLSPERFELCPECKSAALFNNNRAIMHQPVVSRGRE
jgi:ferredoxin